MSWSSGSRSPGRVATEGRVGRRLIERLDEVDVEARLWTRSRTCLDFLSLPQDPIPAPVPCAGHTWCADHTWDGWRPPGPWKDHQSV